MTPNFDFVHPDARKLTAAISIHAIIAQIGELPSARLTSLERRLLVSDGVIPVPMAAGAPLLERAEYCVTAAAASGDLQTYVPDPTHSGVYYALSPRLWTGRHAPTVVPEILVKCGTLTAWWDLVPQASFARRFANQAIFLDKREADMTFRLNTPATLEEAREAAAIIVGRAKESPGGRIKKEDFLKELRALCGNILLKLMHRMGREETPPEWRMQGRIPGQS